MIDPVGPGEGSELDVLEATPGISTPDHLGITDGGLELPAPDHSLQAQLPQQTPHRAPGHRGFPRGSTFAIRCAPRRPQHSSLRPAGSLPTETRFGELGPADAPHRVGEPSRRSRWTERSAPPRRSARFRAPPGTVDTSEQRASGSHRRKPDDPHIQRTDCGVAFSYRCPKYLKTYRCVALASSGTGGLSIP